ncbi:MAG: hypothetical protein ACOYLQ_06545 [Hyphomicrobiaceae bacterium]
MSFRILMRLATVATLALALTVPAQAADKATYAQTARDGIKAMATGSLADVDGWASKMEALSKIGLDYCREVGAKDAKAKKYLDFVVANVEKIKATDFAKFEDEWGDSGAGFKAAGIDTAEFDQTGAAASAGDAVIHPLAALAALREFKKTKSADLLKKASEELEEVLGHLKHLE